jgi:hypothetical protein
MVVPPRTNHPASDRTMTQANQWGHNGRPIKLERFADGGQIPAFLGPEGGCPRLLANGGRDHELPGRQIGVDDTAWW